MKTDAILRTLEKLGQWRGRPLALGLLALLVVLRIFDPGPLESLRLNQFDFFQKLKPRVWNSQPVVIVDIDEHSLKTFGQWPWPRNLVANLIDKIAEGRPLAIGFDIFFPEPDRMSPQRILDDIPGVDKDLADRISALPSHDTTLAESIKKAPVILGMGALFVENYKEKLPPLNAAPALEDGGDPRAALPAYNFLIRSIDELNNAAKGRAVLTAVPERDGVVRRVPLTVDVQGTLVPALTVEMLRVAAGAPWFKVMSGKGGVTSINVPPFTIPTDRDGRAWVHFSPHQDKRFVSAAEVLKGNVDLAGMFESRFILLGTTGLGLTDFPATPVTANMPGVEIHAQLLETIIADAVLTRPDYAEWIEIGAVILAGLILILLVPLLKPHWSYLPLAGIVALFGLAGWTAYDQLTILVDAAYPSVSSAVVYATLLGATLVESDRQRRVLQEELEVERAAAERLEGELTAARNIQMGILPSDFKDYAEQPAFDLHAMLEPAKAVGGDLYDFCMIDEDHLFFIVGDVAGKGVPASLFMALTKALYKSSTLRRKVGTEEIMTEANAEISRENPAMMFVTALSGILDIRTGELEFCNAGHDSPYLYGKGVKSGPLDSTGGPPLCALDDFEFPRDTYRMKPGEGILIFTDGVTEAMNFKQELYNTSRLENFLDSLDEGLTSKQVVDQLYADVKKHVDGADPSDDITILALRYNG